MGSPGPEIDLAKAAVRAFEEAHEDPPEGLVASFRLWHYPGEGVWVTWVVFVPPGGEPYEEAGRVREVGWNRPADLQRAQGRPTEPELWTRDAVLPPALLRRALSRAGHTALLADHLGSPASFPDWTEFGIEGFARNRSTERIQWEAPVPYPFRTIAVWYSRTRGLLRDRLEHPPQG